MSEETSKYLAELPKPEITYADTMSPAFSKEQMKIYATEAIATYISRQSPAPIPEQVARASGIEGLRRFGFDGTLGGDFEEGATGPYVLIGDVERLLATQSAQEVTQQAAKAETPTAWLATDLDGRGDVAFTKEEAKRRAGEGCTEFFPLYDLVPTTSTVSASGADGSAA